ncbi:lipoate--protein ligase [Mycoplasma procyoni]|uniref:lipoate--protein ligase n=1 Tax=Mycoplasma procyoni TaxID=568784 RepID=UPI00197B79C6|nr:lipoate--protein ligase [Mycoplasma procyoni]MBN3534825.1 lipoate--protein ligase [Mycoplasma procyoni]
MKIFISNNYSPYVNLVLEELMIKDEENKEDIIYLYQHENAVIIGQNQNAHKEVKLDVLKEQNIELYRRLSGGGAVYHDKGNVNFSFITKKDERSYEKFLAPVLEFLKSLGLNAEFKGRNDLVINGAKFSGNAQFIYKDRMVHHGTILFDANLAKLSQVLNPSKLKMQSKGIESARQRVTNLIDELEDKISVHEFIFKFADFLAQKYDGSIQAIDKKYYDQVDELKAFRMSDEWLYGKNPEFSFFNELKTNGGILQISANIVKNRIENIAFEGDFLSKTSLVEIENKIKGTEYLKEKIKEKLETIENLSEYFGNITVDEILLVMFGD